MDVGVMLPIEGEVASRRAILESASAAEALGYHSVWVSDRMLKPVELPEGYPYSPTRARTAFRPERNWLDAIAVMGLVAGVTSRVKIGTHVLVLPYRNPIVLAQEAATLDALTDGRILLGIGVGWMEKEFAALGVPKRQRGDRTDEYISIMRELWSHPDGASFRGRYFEFADMILAARPCRPGGPPILIGGNSPAALARTARLGDGWAGVDLPPQEAALVVTRLRALHAEQGRSAEGQLISLKRRLTGPSATGAVVDSSPDEVMAELVRYQEAGVDLLVLDVMATPDQLAALNWIGRNVLPQLQSHPRDASRVNQPELAQTRDAERLMREHLSHIITSSVRTRLAQQSLAIRSRAASERPSAARETPSVPRPSTAGAVWASLARRSSPETAAAKQDPSRTAGQRAFLPEAPYCSMRRSSLDLSRSWCARFRRRLLLCFSACLCRIARLSRRVGGVPRALDCPSWS